MLSLSVFQEIKGYLALRMMYCKESNSEITTLLPTALGNNGPSVEKCSPELVSSVGFDYFMW